MSRVSNEQIYSALLNLSKDVGEIKAQSKSNGEAIATHSADDTRRFTGVYERVSKVENAQSRQKGFMTGIGTVGTALGAALGYLVERFGFGGGH